MDNMSELVPVLTVRYLVYVYLSLKDQSRP